MHYDAIEKLHHSTIQHGPANDRVYLMKAAPQDAEMLPAALRELAEHRGYGKVFCKAPASIAKPFLAAGYRQEASASGLFGGREDGLFLALFLKSERGRCAEPEQHDNNLALAAARQDAGAPKPAADLTLRPCEPGDAEAMAAIYREVFPSYPFPIHDPAYLHETMASHVYYYAAERGGELLALSSAESDPAAANVEMTDFATLPAARGAGLATALLARMERDMAARDFRTAFTIARAASPGMNITFARMGYAYGGHLVNNTWISGAIECMNVWHKPLKAEA